MRDIKFRCWFPKGTDTGDGEIEKGEMCYDLAFDEYEPINDLLNGVDHLMQFTGLKDKNGKDIYEGDIVRTRFKDMKNLVIIFRDGGFSASAEYPKEEVESLPDMSLVRDGAEVIGNVCETPELLEVKK